MMVELKGLCKRFGKRVALKDFSLSMPRGQIYGLLGHNGAGKSTAIGLLLGHLMPDRGEARIDGVDVAQERARAIRKTGAIFETPAFYPYLSGHRNLRIFAQYSGYTPLDRMNEVIHLVGLADRIHEPVRRYSHGMRQRLALAQALLPDPDLLILDEPTDGLDPEGIHEMRELVRLLNREFGLTILLSSHLLGEVERLCHGVGILYQGNLLFDGDWRAHASSSRCRLITARPDEAKKLLLDRGLIFDAKAGRAAENGSDGVVEFLLAENIPPGEIPHVLVRGGIPLSGFEAGAASLEEFYLRTLRQWREVEKT